MFKTNPLNDYLNLFDISDDRYSRLDEYKQKFLSDFDDDKPTSSNSKKAIEDYNRFLNLLENEELEYLRIESIWQQLELMTAEKGEDVNEEEISLPNHLNASLNASYSFIGFLISKEQEKRTSEAFQERIKSYNSIDDISK
ncbi:hypothetical protein [Leeuwenhoekiella sp. NPDC079379]|uniref:hypothetical protein n=1 Tax=Leeuwenhoekiella sp. NPDC079379 TaxID=3364122 RepID=UPI0037C82B95